MRRRAVRWLVCLCVLLAPMRSEAATVALQSFSDVNHEATNPELFAFIERLGGGATDADIGPSTTVLYNAANGGHDSLRWTLRSAVTAGRTAYYTRAALLNGGAGFTTGAVRRCVHPAALPASGARQTLLATLHAQNASPGLVVDVTDTGALNLRWGSSTSIGTTTGTIKTNGCQHNPQYGCAVAGDCPKYCSTTNAPCQTAAECLSGESCLTDTCGGGTLHFTCLDLGWSVQSPTSVLASLRVDGLPEWVNQQVAVSGAGPVVDVADGASGFGGGSGALTAYYSAGKIVSGATTVGLGYPVVQVPSANGTTQNWSASSCGGSSHVLCVDDYGDSGMSYRYSSGNTANDNITTSSAAKQEFFSALAPTLTLRSGETVQGVQVHTYGRTGSGAGARLLQHSLLVNGAVAMSSAFSSLATNTTPDRLLSTLWTSPPAGQTWTAIRNALGVRWATGTSTDAQIRVGAVQVVLDVARSETVAVRNLTERVLGKNTNARSLACWCGGDSLLAGTTTGGCSQTSLNPGAICTVSKYCSDDPDGDKACGSDADCGKCSVDGSIFCSADTDCPSGTCDLSATCVEACPGGECVNDSAGWCGSLPGRIGCDVIVACPHGSEDSAQALANRWNNLLRGRFNDAFGACPGGAFLQGTGQCECNTDAECGAGASACTKTCLGTGAACTGTQGTQGSCPVGDLCIGLCTASDSGRDQCTNGAADGSCAAGRFCVALPSYIVVQWASNDPTGTYFFANAETGNADPECRLGHPGSGSGSGQPPAMCPQINVGGNPATQYACPRVFCNEDADGSHVGQCIGVTSAGGPCRSGGTCTAHLAACGSDADCPNGQTCLGNASGIPTYKIGTCTCTSDTQCNSPTALFSSGTGRCVIDAAAYGTGRGVCRKGCTAPTNAPCSPGACIDNGTSDYCEGIKSCDCSSITCNSDADCGGYTQTSKWGGLRSRFYQGTCHPVLHRCFHCGPPFCALKPAWKGPCSCSTSADCAPNGTCDATTKLCTASEDPAKLDCRVDNQCAAGQRCMSAYRQVRRGFLAGHRHPLLFVDVVQRMERRIRNWMTDLGDTDGGPLLLPFEPPIPGGRKSNGEFVPDGSCANSFRTDVDYHRAVGAALRRLYPKRRLVSLSGPTGFNQRRIPDALHADEVHTSLAGTESMTTPVVATFNRLGACVGPAGDGLLWCRSITGTYSGLGCQSSCPGALCVPKPCTSNADCPLWTPNPFQGAAGCLCAIDANCGTGGVCNTSTFTCTAGSHATCTTDADCLGGTGSCAVQSVCGPGE